SCSSSPRCWGVSSSPPELDLNLFNVPGEFERHIRVVFVDDWCSGILTDVETFIEGELADGRSVLDAAFRNFLAIDHEGAEATFAEPAAVVLEVKIDGVLAGRKLLAAGNTSLVGSLFRIFRSILIRVRVGEHRLPI